jgi:hypothetical protein
MTAYSLDIRGNMARHGIVIVGGGPWLCCLANGGAESRALRGAFGTGCGPCSCREQHTAIQDAAPFFLS